MNNIKKTILSVVIFLGGFFICQNTFAACTGSSPRWTSTADYTSVNSCVSGATPGDTITVTGNATWTQYLTITRGIKLVGSGNPTLSGQLTYIYWEPDTTAKSNHETLSIKGFTFDAGNTTSNSGIIYVHNQSGSYVYLIASNNTFKNTVSRGVMISGTVYGVIYSNTFDRIGSPLTAGGADYNSWANQTQAYGVAKNLYFEDNTIKFSSSWTNSPAGWMESGQGGRSVVRYNTWDYTNATQPGEAWDIHGIQAPPVCQNYSTMVSEYYGNKIINMVNAYRWMFHRGGWLAMFYNTLSGNTSPINQVTQYFCSSCAETGSYEQKATNSYYWRNFVNSTESPFGRSDDRTADPITENTDYFNYAAAVNGAQTTGVGCGTLANRPATCTTGVGYWATNQSCSNMTGMVGASPSMPISGTLYKCTATNMWKAYYTPYTYPHPLATTTSTTITPPQNLRIVNH